MKDIKIVEVKSATSAKAFLPFTALPDDFATHRVAVIKLSRRQEADIKAALAQGLSIEIDFRAISKVGP